MASNALTFHPLAHIFPLLEGEEFTALTEDIRQRGIREAAWVYDSQILDGRNRYRACETLGIECPTRVYDGDDPVGFVVSVNPQHQKLNSSQRAMIAAKLVDWDKQQRAALQAARSQWIQNARATFVPGEPQPCVICGRYREVTHAHHIYPLAMQAAHGKQGPLQDYCWLCPTHHAGIHKALSALLATHQSFSFADDAPEQRDRLHAINQRFMELRYDI